MEIRELRAWNNQYLREPKILLDEGIIYVPPLTEVHDERQEDEDVATITYLLIHPFLKTKIAFQILEIHGRCISGETYVLKRSFKRLSYNQATRILRMGIFKKLYEHYGEWSYEVFGDDP